jgi:hypothetical protein
MKSSDRQIYEEPIRELLAIMMLSEKQISKAPLEILHKYMIRNENYQIFLSLLNSALPVQIFSEDSDWAADIILELRKHHSKNATKMEDLYKTFTVLKKFMVKNKMFIQELTTYPDPEVDSKFVIDSFIGEKHE